MQADPYKLAPIQEGMLFHWLLDRHSGTDVEQIMPIFEGQAMSPA